MMLFAFNTSRSFGQAVATRLDLTLGELEERDFEDGEHKVRPLTSVRGADVYVIQSLYGDDERTVNDKLVRCLFFLGALRDAGASTVTAVLPYLAYARKDRKTKTRDPITTRYVAQLFESMGVDRVVTMDVHNLAAFENAFRAPTVHLEAAPVFVEHFVGCVSGRPAVVVSPDSGGVKRADRLRQLLRVRLDGDVSLAIMEKHRSRGVVSGDLFVGDVKGREAIIVDDLISTGTTLARAAAACRDRGAVAVRAAATHALMVGDAGSVLAAEAIDEVLVANTVPVFRLRGEPAEEKLRVLDVSATFAAAIGRLHRGEPFEGETMVAP